MNRILCAILFLSTSLSSGLLKAQVSKITYSDPEREDSRRTNFDVVGKVGGNYLVFKNNNSTSAICVYDEGMKLLNRVPLAFMPDKYANVDFVAYPDYFYLIYEYQHKNIVHCTAVKINGSGQKIGDPVELDTTLVGSTNSNKIYTTIVSEDKQRLMIFKINSKNPKNYMFTTFLYDNNLQLVDRHRIYLSIKDERNEMFTDFLLDNDGVLAFGKYLRSGSNDYITNVALVTKGAVSDSFAIRNISEDRILDEIKMKADNNNKRFIITGFYYRQKKGNIEGLYSVVWDKQTDSRLKENVTIFNDELRAVAKSSDASLKMAFNDFFIKHIITKRDGGYLIISESLYTTSRGNMFNRWDYMNSPYGAGGFYSPYYYNNPYYNPWNRNYGNYATRYHAENIMVLSFDKDGNLQWSNVIPKQQFDDESENLISHELVNTGGELHFLFNLYERRNMLLNDQSISPEGKITRYPTLKNLDKGYDFMPRYGKQVSSWETIMPCMYRNYLCFAKVDF